MTMILLCSFLTFQKLQVAVGLCKESYGFYIPVWFSLKGGKENEKGGGGVREGKLGDRGVIVRYLC